jgi:hypothetical protein
MMLTRPLHHLRRNVIGYLALVLALGAGGGYAYAATRTKTIRVCADKKTGILHLKKRGRCARAQTRVTWNQQGPQGPAGPAGQNAISLWVVSDASGNKLAGTVNVSHTALGQYEITGPPPPTPTRLCAVTVTPNFSGSQLVTANVAASTTGYTVYLAQNATPVDDNFSAILQC